MFQMSDNLCLPNNFLTVANGDEKTQVHLNITWPVTTSLSNAILAAVFWPDFTDM